ncbi:MAG TPA: ABC transporter permease [Isosphaeraceae bacterium]|jgi:ribose/xylose/arabinose/galactoside ABC-type transport system permease subunit|nr:ABC transporter permease [Isosphaeraceae bacterium]
MNPRGAAVGVGVEDVGAKPRAGRSALRGALRGVWTVLGPFVGLLLIIALFAYLTRKPGMPLVEACLNAMFLEKYNWQMIAQQTVILWIAALGMTVVMIAGGIDLSVGSLVALVTVAIALAVKGFDVQLPVSLGGQHWQLPGVPLVVALIGGVLLGGLCGLFNGAFITGLRVVPFIITLGSMRIFRGLAKWLAGNNTVNVPAATWTTRIGQVLRERVLVIEPRPEWLVVAPGVWLALALSVVMATVLHYSLFGRHAYAVGSNEATARLCGLNVPRQKLAIYALAGLATGLAGALQFLKLSVGDPTTADGLELEVIAAVVIGGGSLSGGEGTVLGTLIGCLIITTLRSGCTQADIPDAAQDVIIGAIIVAAVAIDRLRRGRAS